MRRLSAAEVTAQKVTELGLDSSALDLTSIEAIAGALRRSAGFLCPCSAPSLVRSVVRPLRGLVSDLELIKTIVEDTLDAIVAHGDLVESRQFVDESDRPTGGVLYAAPPSFVLRDSGAVILLGIASDHLSALPDELQDRIENEGYVRRLSPRPGEGLRDELVELGLIELANDAWLKMPDNDTPSQFLARIDRLLDVVTPSREIPGLTILETERPVRYYRGRWIEPKAHTGRFVGRRRQAYGADLWCYVELRDGCPQRLIDLPISAGRWRGCDEAWHLQSAIDALRGAPQQYRLLAGPSKSTVIQLFSPIPMWASRRWDAIGEPVPSSGCLFAYRIRDSELSEELAFARNSLWLQEVSFAGNRK